MLETEAYEAPVWACPQCKTLHEFRSLHVVEEQTCSGCGAKVKVQKATQVARRYLRNGARL
jgi:uncharacterized paraquat-inducible protein A